MNILFRKTKSNRWLKISSLIFLRQLANEINEMEKKNVSSKEAWNFELELSLLLSKRLNAMLGTVETNPQATNKATTKSRTAL